MKKTKRQPASPPAVATPTPAYLREIPILAGIFLLAIVLRGIFLAQLSASPLWTTLMVDAQAYHNWAMRLAAGDWIGRDVFYQAPLYPYFLGILYRLFGPDPTVARVAQVLLDALSCVMIYRAGTNLFNRSIGLLSALLLACYSTAIFFTAILQKASIDLFLTTLLLMLISELMRKSRPRRWLALGVITGLLILTRENALILLPVLIAWLWIHFKDQSAKIRLAWMGMLLLGLALVLGPVAARNTLVGGEFHLTTSQFGPNFYIGNHLNSNGLYTPLKPGRGSTEFERIDATDIAEQALGHKLTPGEVSHYWTVRTFQDIKADPSHWIALMIRKWMLVWNAGEIADADDLYATAEFTPLLRAASYVVHFGIIFPLAFLGVCATWNRRRQLWVMYLLPLTFAFSVAMFCIYARYRFPLVPMLLPFAGAGIVALRDLLARPSAGSLLMAGGLLVGSALVVNTPMVDQSAMRAIGYYNIAGTQANQGDTDGAIRTYQQVLALWPNHADAQLNLGRMFARKNQIDQAIEHYRAALNLRKDYAEAHNHLGAALLLQNNLPEASVHLTEALRLKPDYPEAHYNLAGVYTREGKPDQAIDHYQQVIRLKPDLPDAHNNLGLLLAGRNQIAEAADHFRTAIKLSPAIAEYHCNLGGMLATQRQFDAAILELREALRLRPDFQQARQNMEMISQELRQSQGTPQ